MIELTEALLPWIQLVISVLLIVAVLLQQTGASVGGSFGGADMSTNITRRGTEKFLLRATIVLGIVFALSAFVSLLL